MFHNVSMLIALLHGSLEKLQHVDIDRMLYRMGELSCSLGRLVDI